MLAPGETIDPGIIRADLDFTAGMKRHYAASSPSASRLPSWTTFGVVWGLW
ncbi:MAG TPA: hypothetical protein VMM36_14020 [Opitutaceae bacterium]|nr:hypothetical protein [Opitutaceae bacterium]